MDNVDFHIAYQVTGSQGFNDNRHLNHFLNYLFRTDVAQKNTNELTTQNIAFFPKVGGFQAHQFGDLEKRKKVKALADDHLKVFAESNAYLVENDIMYFTTHNRVRGVVDDATIYDIHWLNEQEGDFFVDTFLLLMKNRKDLDRCLFHVVHIDQNKSEFHIHSVKLK